MQTSMILVLGSWLLVAATPGVAQDTPLHPLNVSKKKIAFDPKTCAIGAHGGVHTGCGGVSIVIVSRKNGVCEFLYKTDGCGGVLADYRVRVPVEGGLVTIEVDNGGIKDSFAAEKKKLVRSSGPGGMMEVVEVSGEDVVVRRMGKVSEMVPAKGDRVRFRFRFYTDPRHEADDQTVMFNQAQEFVVGSVQMWPWVAAVMKDMTVGDTVKVELPTKIIGGATKWLSQAKPEKVRYVEVRMVSLERGK